MNAKDRSHSPLRWFLLFALVPLATALVLAGCQPKAGDETTDSLTVTTETPAPAPAPSATGATRFVESSNGTEVVVAPGAEFEVALMTDPTTGMSWAWVDSTNSSIVLIERSTIVGEGTDGTVGSAGATVWRFRAPSTGSAPLQLELRRPGEATAAQTYMITVKPE